MFLTPHTSFHISNSEGTVNERALMYAVLRRIKRFIERDRLQAMFADKIILIASYLQGQGDSGSRHAMAKAKEYGKERFVMYNEQTDGNRPIFALNKSLIADGAKIITSRTLDSF